MGWTGRYTETGVFVCFEGGEGSGKSTQSLLLSDRLVAEGYAVRLTFEPGDTAVGKEVRRIVLSPETGDLDDRTEALLYAADKAEHVETVVLDLAPEAGLGRFDERDRIEGESLEFHLRVRQAFLDLAAANPDHYLVLDARADVGEIAAAIRERVAPLLGQAGRGRA